MTYTVLTIVHNYFYFAHPSYFIHCPMSSQKTRRSKKRSRGHIDDENSIALSETTKALKAPVEKNAFVDIHEDGVSYEIVNDFKEYVDNIQRRSAAHICCSTKLVSDSDAKETTKDNTKNEVVFRIHHVATTNCNVKTFVSVFLTDDVLSKYIYKWGSNLIEGKWIAWKIKFRIPLNVSTDSVVRRLCILYTVETWYGWKNIPRLYYVDYCVHTTSKVKTIGSSCFVELSPMGCF